MYVAVYVLCIMLSISWTEFSGDSKGGKVTTGDVRMHII